MALEHFISLILFAFAACFTPGPNNIMLMTSGANLGYKRTLPHMLGVMIGFAVMIALVSIGLLQVLESNPAYKQLLQYFCASYLVYLALKIALAKPEIKSAAGYKPMSFLASASFQWVNPKAWTMAFSFVTLFLLDLGLVGLAITLSIYFAILFMSTSLWTYAGLQLKRWINTPVRMRGFNLAMAGLLLSTLLQIQ